MPILVCAWVRPTFTNIVFLRNQIDFFTLGFSTFLLNFLKMNKTRVKEHLNFLYMNVNGFHYSAFQHNQTAFFTRHVTLRFFFEPLVLTHLIWSRCDCWPTVFLADLTLAEQHHCLLTYFLNWPEACFSFCNQFVFSSFLRCFLLPKFVFSKTIIHQCNTYAPRLSAFQISTNFAILDRITAKFDYPFSKMTFLGTSMVKKAIALGHFFGKPPLSIIGKTNETVN